MNLFLTAVLTALYVGQAAHAADTTLAEAQYPEGALWHGQRLYYAEMGRDVVMASDLTTAQPFWRAAACGPVSIAPYRGDEFLILCHLAHKIVRVSLSGKTLAVIDRDANGRPFAFPNASSADAAGGVYFSSSGAFSLAAPAAGAVLYLDAASRLTRVAQGIRYANGVAVDAPRERLLVSAHLARRLLAFPIEAPGRLGPRAVFFDLDAAGIARGGYPLAGPDGLEVAPSGEVVVAEYGAGRIHKISAAGEWLGTQDGFAPFVTDLALLPGDRAAVTASRVNDTPPFSGLVVVRARFLESFVK